MTFSEIFEVPTEARAIEPLLADARERAIVEAMGRCVYTEPELLSMIETHFKSEQAAEDSRRQLDSMYRRAVLNKEALGDAVGYCAATTYVRLAYLAQYEREAWLAVPEETRLAIDAWYLNQYAQSALPRLEAVQRGTREVIENAYFFTLEETVALIDDIDSELYVVPCNCRSLRSSCAHLKNVCILFETGFNSEYDRGHGERLSKDAAKALVKRAHADGLMHTSETRHAICNCCGDCCYPIRASEIIGAVGLWPKQRYTVQVDETRCVQCGKCVATCHFDAFTLTDKLVFNQARCRGCTLCASRCPVDAIVLEAVVV